MKFSRNSQLPVMASISRQWWEYLAPKNMHGRLREIASLLQKWFCTAYGAHWLSVALKAGPFSSNYWVPRASS